MLGVAEADLQLEGGFVRVKGAPGMRKSLAELVDANDRRSGASRWRVVASRAARVHELTADGGPRGFESISLQQRVSDEPLLAPEPSRSASVQETTGGSTGQPKNLRGTDGSNPSPSSGESCANLTWGAGRRQRGAPVALGVTGEPLSRRRPSHGVAMQGSAK